MKNDIPTIGWIGAGNMGRPLVSQLLNKNYPVVLFTRSKNKAKDLINQGAVWQESPSEVAQRCDILISMLGYPHEVEEVYLDPLNGVLVTPRCKIIVDMTTSSPDLAISLADRALEKGIHVLDAPVLVSKNSKTKKKLYVLVGGDERIYQEVLEVLLCFGEKVFFMGESGSGQHAKICELILTTSAMIGTCEALLYASRAGLDEVKVNFLINHGLAVSQLTSCIEKHLMQDVGETGLLVNYFLKDLGIALDECHRMNLKLPGLEFAYGLYRQILVLSKQYSVSQALIQVLKEMI